MISKKQYQPKTGARCSCRRGIERDNCAACEGTGWRIDFAKIRAQNKPEPDPIDIAYEDQCRDICGL